MSSHASSPIGSSRFEDFKDEQVQRAAMRFLAPHLEDSALVVLGRRRKLAGARAIHEKRRAGGAAFPAPSTTISPARPRWDSIRLSRSRINPSNQLKATSAAMGSIFFVVMGCRIRTPGAGLRLSPGRRASWVNEHPDPDAYIDGRGTRHPPRTL